MAKQKTDAPEAEGDADLMAVVEATDPQKETVPEQPTPTRSEPMTEAPAAPPPPAARQGGLGAFLGMVLGGAVAAGAGFGLARAMPDLLPIGPDAVDVTATLDAQAAEIADLKAQIAALPAPDTGLADRVAALETAAPAPADTTDIDARLATLEDRLVAIESQPSDGTGLSPAILADIAALKEQVATLGTGGTVPADVLAAVAAAEARLTEAETRAAALAEQSTASAAAITRAAAIGRIAAALDSGAPYSSALPDLGDLPPVLADNAAAGLPTIADLQDSFAPAARASLEAALRANMGESWTERVSSFLRSQTGLRSLTPREGDDPDAVLSRAEAALSAGQVAEAIAELQAMPEAGKPALQDWLTLAQTRVDAEAAVAALAVN
jgi:hypothetical protein